MSTSLKTNSIINRLSIVGCGGHARSVYAVTNAQWNVCNFIDCNALPNEEIYGIPVIKNERKTDGWYIIAIGDNNKRKKFYREHKEYKYINAIADTAVLCNDISLENGIFIANFAYIGPQCKIGKQTILNTGAILEHESSIGNFSHIAPHSTVCGRCNIGDNVFIGAGATVIDGITICNDVIIGAGATVISDIMCPGVYCGTPARKVK